jgi:hypothetical protein
MSRKSFTFFGRSSSLLLLIFYKLLMALVEMLAGSLCLLTAFFAKHLEVVRVIKESAGDDQLDQFVRWLTEHYHEPRDGYRHRRDYSRTRTGHNTSATASTD